MGRICPNCGSAVEDNARFCDECGAALPTVNVEPVQHVDAEAPKINMYQNSSMQSQINSAPKQQPAFQNSPSGNLYSTNTNVQPASAGAGAMAIISLIAGILSLVTCGCYLLPQIVAIVCAIFSKKVNGKMSGVAKAGLITGIIGAVLCCLLLVIGIIAGIAESM